VTAGLARAGDADLYYQVDGAGPDTLVLVNGVGDPLEGWAGQSTQPAAAFAAQTAALVDHDARDRLAALTTPTLVIAAADDIIIRPALSRALFEALPEAAWTVVPGGHAAFWEESGPWNQAVLEFVHAHR
jgi:pimeloyl-ACP methyl ester carboxylesterase